MAESPAGRVPIQRRGHARFQVYSNPRSGRSYPQGMGIHFLELPPELVRGSRPLLLTCGEILDWNASRTCSAGPSERPTGRGSLA